MNLPNKKRRQERLDRAKELRKQFKGWTVTAIADELKISKQAVSRILRK